uniref:Uncharacterized protein n=1 Tax=Arundo donax TaxID=35708 RepID=A0A0A9S710_ARUDO
MGKSILFGYASLFIHWSAWFKFLPPAFLIVTFFLQHLKTYWFPLGVVCVHDLS